MNKKLTTLKIMTENGPVMINAQDYDTDVHTLADDQAAPHKPSDTVDGAAGTDTVDGAAGTDTVDGAAGTDTVDGAAPAEPTGTAAYVVQSEGNKHFIADAEGKRVKGVKGVATKGYSTPADAWAAIMALNTSE